MPDGPEKKGLLRLGGDAVFPSLVQVQYHAKQICGRAVVKHNSLTLDLPVGRGQLSPYPGLNTTTANICRMMSRYKSRL